MYAWFFSENHNVRNLRYSRNKNRNRNWLVNMFCTPQFWKYFKNFLQLAWT